MTKIEKLLSKLHYHYTTGRTVFNEPEKKYLVTSYYTSALEMSADIDDEEQLYYLDDIEDLPTYYGATLIEALEKAVEGEKQRLNN